MQIKSSCIIPAKAGIQVPAFAGTTPILYGDDGVIVRGATGARTSIEPYENALRFAPIGVKDALAIDTAVSVSAKAIAQRLQQICRQALLAVAVDVGE